MFASRNSDFSYFACISASRSDSSATLAFKSTESQSIASASVSQNSFRDGSEHTLSSSEKDYSLSDSNLLFEK